MITAAMIAYYVVAISLIAGVAYLAARQGLRRSGDRVEGMIATMEAELVRLRQPVGSQPGVELTPPSVPPQAPDADGVARRPVGNRPPPGRAKRKGKRRGQVLSLTGAADSHLRLLATLPRLRELYLRRTHVSDLSSLVDLPRLTVLHLVDTEVSDLAPLARLKRLKALSLRGTRVTDLSPLGGLPRLVRLDLRDTSVSEQQLRALKAARHDLQILV